MVSIYKHVTVTFFYSNTNFTHVNNNTKFSFLSFCIGIVNLLFCCITVLNLVYIILHFHLKHRIDSNLLSLMCLQSHLCQKDISQLWSFYYQFWKIWCYMLYGVICDMWIGEVWKFNIQNLIQNLKLIVVQIEINESNAKSIIKKVVKN